MPPRANPATRRLSVGACVIEYPRFPRKPPRWHAGKPAPQKKAGHRTHYTGTPAFSLQKDRRGRRPRRTRGFAPMANVRWRVGGGIFRAVLDTRRLTDAVPPSAAPRD